MRDWTESAKEYAWSQARTVQGWDGRVFRQDACGAIIEHSQYGKRQTTYGWEIDHIVPLSIGGADEFGNIQALHWENNVAKGSKENWHCAVGSDFSGANPRNIRYG